MPPEENKTQDTSQQDSAQTKFAVAETPVPVKQSTESVPVIKQKEAAQTTSAPQAQEEIPIVEPLVESTTEQVETPKTEEIQPQVVEEELIAPTAQSTEPQPQTISKSPPPHIKEKIIYKTDPNIVQKLLIKARAKIQERKRKKLDKIMTLFEAKPQITNKDIQKLLRTSRVSAFRYLNTLESQNKIKQVGNTGKSVFYTKI